MDDAIVKVKAFVEGDLLPKQFEQLVYSDKAIEQLARTAPAIPPYSGGSSDLYDYLINVDFSKPSHLLNAQDALSRLLDLAHITHKKSKVIATNFELLGAVQPKWLDIPEDYFAALLDEGRGLKGSELKVWLKAEILRRFKVVSKPPKWLQSPAWPLQQGEPLTFVGQLSVGEILHDTAAVYVFLNPSTREVCTVLQKA
jgi:hypothetical protein